MIQDSHVVALHISLRCVEVAATMRRSCVGLSCICATPLWRPVWPFRLNVMNVNTMMKVRPTGRHSFPSVDRSGRRAPLSPGFEYES